MSVNEDWDVEQHKVEYESDEHWELRRNFLLAHKDKFSEDALVCLAQVFVNVELLGCRYPQETMDLVKELSEDIAAKYREKQKKKLQRTFVEASQAASSKVKGCVAGTSTVTEERILNIPNNISNTTKHIDQLHKNCNLKKRSSPNINKSGKLSTTNYESYEKSNIKEPLSKRLKTEKNILRDNPYRDIILWERSDDIPQSTLGNSASISGVNLDWKYSMTEGIWECSIYINSKKVACYTNSNKKTAKNEAAIAALNELRKHCYTVKVKQNLDSKSNVTVTTKEMKPQECMPDNDWKASSSCIGEELMRRMGWTGGGLGKSEQGVIEPMSAIVKPQISRKGLGLKSNSCTANEMKAKCRNLFKDFLQTDMQNDIVFLDFTNEERSAIHQIARTMGLKSRSYGSTDQRKLIVSRKIDVRSLVRELKSLGGITEKYELMEPTDEKFISSTSMDS